MSLATLRLAFRPLLNSLATTRQVLFSPQCLLYTNTGLTVALSITGDVFQQWYQSARKQNSQPWDKRRTAHMAGTGLLIAPFIHYWYVFLDRWLPGRTFRILWRKVLMDQLVCSPVYLSIFVLSLGIMEGRSWENIKDDVRGKGSVLYVAEWVVWPPAQFVNFYFLPSKYRVLYDNTISLAFDTFWSYVWYEMEKEEDKGDETANKKSLTDGTEETKSIAEG
ncbi:hypothetical protein BaRGS_00008487 [Batillaria attramentaria]|uniref:Mpv17-like protein 2 n=1 Tax=Batillaria attramentaria TaxID=370345 RepID=A0ABD0LL70_9CAEN